MLVLYPSGYNYLKTIIPEGVYLQKFILYLYPKRYKHDKDSYDIIRIS